MSGAPPIAQLLPQAGAMVLLDAVMAHDERRISCRATSHRDPGNPLVHEGVLPAWAAVEYAAQAMAAHFSIRAGAAGGGAAIGLLGGLRDVVCEVERLDDIDAALLIEAERLSHDSVGSVYAFSVMVEADRRMLVQGRATVVQQVGRPSPPAPLSDGEEMKT